MNEDKTTGSDAQEPPSSTNQRSVEFLYAFGGFDPHGLFLAGSIPGDKPLVIIGHYTEAALRKLPHNQRHHITAAVYPNDLKSRDDDKIVCVPFIVFDDIGKKIVSAPGTTSITDGIEIDEDAFDMVAEPSWKIETRRDRYQYGYHFDPVLTPAQARHIHKALKRHPIFGPGLHAVGQYFRLPSGTNTKPDGRGFETKFIEESSCRSWTFGMFCREFGIDQTAQSSPAAVGVGSATGETLSPEAVGELLALIPNNRPEGGDLRKGRHYDQWTRTGLAIWGATGGDGFKQFDEWSQKSDKYNADLTREKWDGYSSAKGSASTLRKIIEEIHGVDSEERREANRIFDADRDVEFPDLDEDDLAAAGAKAKKAASSKPANDAETRKAQDEEFRALLKEARKLAKIPDLHRGGDDENWLKADRFVGGFASAAVLQPASPTLFTPFDRGVVSVRTGAPFVGKSLLMLNQVCAFCYGRGDLLGSGFTDDDIQFQGDVLYVSNEDSEPVVRRRISAWMKRWGVGAGDTSHEVYPVRSLLLARKGADTLIGCLRILRAAVEHLRGGRDIAMIVVDTMSASITGVEENSSKETGEVLMLLREIAGAFWTSVVFIHHGTKNAWKAGEDEADLGSALRGSGSFGGTVRGADNVRKLKEPEKAKKGWAGRGKVLGLSVLKASDSGDAFGERFFELETVDLAVLHAEKVGVQVSKKMPVLVPLQLPMAGGGLFRDEGMVADCWRKLVEEAGKGPVWRYKRMPQMGPDKGVAVHDLWAIPVTEASRIIDEWVMDGRISVTSKTARHGSKADQIAIDEVY